MLEIGSMVGGIYKILNVIGKGGMSVVYLAMNEKANKQWAIKEVRKDGIGDFEVVKQGLIVETDMLKKLNHPHLPSIIDVIDNDDTLIIVMDYIEGNALNKALEEYGALSQDKVIMWAKQLCDVLGYLHTRMPPIIYRDMKPSNVMLSPDGKNVTLIDFGTAREYKEKNIADTTCLGTIGYAAPEQFGGQGQTDARTDIYCLGATLYHLVTGQSPCEPPYEIKPIRQWNPALSEGLEKIILKCTQKNPEDRYQSCAELMYDLEHYEELDAKSRKKQKRKLTVFVSLLLASAIFFVGGISAITIKNSKIEEVYDTYMLKASSAASSEESIKQYINAIEIYPDRIEPYISMIEQMTMDDSLSLVEQSRIRELNNDKFIGTIKSDPHYPELAYSIAKLFWSCYKPESSENINQNIINAKPWLDAVVTYKNFENIDVAKVMKVIADYTVEDQRMYNQVESNKNNSDVKKLFDNLSQLLDAVQDDVSNVLRLKSYEYVRYILSTEARYFKRAEIPVDDVLGMLTRLKDSINAIDDPDLDGSKKVILDKFETTEQSIVQDYSMEGSGN